MNKIKNKKLTSGFTAMEIIIVIAISTIIMLAVSTFQRDVIVHNSMIQSGAIAEEGMRIANWRLWFGIGRDQHYYFL